MARIETHEDGSLRVPDYVTVPFVTGDGVGKEITPATHRAAP